MKLINRVLKKILKMMPLGRIVLFESRPDVSDNSKSVFDEMLSRGLNKKYKLLWLVYDDNGSNKIDKKYCVNANGKLATYYLIRAKALISCNRFLPSRTKKQFSVFLAHGTAVKNVSNYYQCPEGIQYCLAASSNTVPLRMTEFSLPESKIIPLGFPRNDLLYKPVTNLREIFQIDFNKIVIWYPTFRQNATGGSANSKNAIPILWNAPNAGILNDFCVKNNILVVIKPHFAQDVSCIKILKLSNILFIDDGFFDKHSISSYSFLASSDALLTDYSSVYYDYTLCDKPIGLIWEDYADYCENPGFAVDVDFMMKGGKKIYNLDDLLHFLNDVKDNVDPLAKERREIRDYVNIANDGMNSKRVVDFIIEKAKL